MSFVSDGWKSVFVGVGRIKSSFEICKCGISRTEFSFCVLEFEVVERFRLVNL